MGDPKHRSKNQQINKNRGDRGARRDHKRLYPASDAAGKSSCRARTTKSGAERSGGTSSDMGGSGTPGGTASEAP